MAKRTKRPFERYEDPQYLEWRNRVLKRDGYSCKTCGFEGGRFAKGLTVHHIKSYARFVDLRFVDSNGITLCQECHKKIHIELRKARPKKRVSPKTRKKISESLKKYHRDKNNPKVLK